MSQMILIGLALAAVALWAINRVRKFFTKKNNQDQDDPWAMNERIKGVQEWLEKNSLLPVFLATLGAFIFRSSFTWTLGAFQVHDIPPDILRDINFVVGIAIACLTELIATMAGRKWWLGWDKKLALDEQAAEASAMAETKIWRPMKDQHNHLIRDSDGNVLREQVTDAKAVKAAALVAKQKKRQMRDNRTYFWFLVIGEISSFYAAMFYAFDVGNLQNIQHFTLATAWSITQDSFLTLLMLVGVFFIGVLYEPSKIDVDELQTEGRKRLRYTVMSAKYKRIKEGQQTNEDIHYLMRSASPQERVELESMIQIDRSQEIWTSAQIMSWLGWAVTKRRDVTRRLKQAFDKNLFPDGIKHDPVKPKQWIATLPTVVSLFGKDFIDSRNAAIQGALTGMSTAKLSDGDRGGGHLPGAATADHGQNGGLASGQSEANQEGRVVDADQSNNGQHNEAPFDDIEGRIKALKEQLELIENALRMELDRDPHQDLDALASRFQMPRSHVEVVRDEILRSRPGLPAGVGPVVDADPMQGGQP